MSAITIGGDLVHYEKLGRGRPVILVHGWIGSWRYWIPLMQKLHLKYSVYTLDLIGFGDSAKNANNYTIDAQVKMLEQFLEQLAISKLAIIGHGLGGMVATRFAYKNPDKVARMMVSSLPLFDPGDLKQRVPAGTRVKLTGNTRYSLAPSIEEVTGSQHNDKTVLSADRTSADRTMPSSGNSGVGPIDEKTITSGSFINESPTVRRPDHIDREALRRAAEERDKAKQQPNPLQQSFKDKTVHALLERCFKQHEPEFEKLKVDVNKSDNRVLLKSAEGFEAGSMLDELRQITAPVVVVHGRNDPIFQLPDEEIWNYLSVEKDDVFIPILLDNVRHFPMLEYEPFSRLTTDFLSVSEISKLEIRERWRRRSR